MSDLAQAEALKDLPKFWQLWRNPLFIRYYRSQLRVGSLITGILLYGGASLLFFLIALGYTTSYTERSFTDTAIWPFGFIVFLQLFIMNFVGTGEVAAGMARESIDEVLTYQRLTPLSPATKIIGYLFGLPIRQFYHFIITLPVTIIIINMGEIPREVWLPIYTVLLTSTFMFYLLAMSVGFIMGKRFSALISQGLVAMLYFALPQLSSFGFVIFEYLTIRPALFSSAQLMMPENPMFESSRYALFYHWEISHTVYCILLQCLISWIFYSILLRRWRLESSHLLSKVQCIVVTALLHVIVLGGIWANTSNGTILQIKLKGHSPKIDAIRETLSQNVELIGATILSLYGLIGFSTVILMQYIYTPDKFFYLAGLRERHKRNQSPFALWHGSASAIPTTIIITAITTLAWLIYAEHLMSSTAIAAFIGAASITAVKWSIVAVTVSTLLAHGLCLENMGRKLTATLACFIWIIPLAAALLFSSWKVGNKASSFIYGFSPISMNFLPGYTLTNIHSDSDPTSFISGCMLGVASYLIISVIGFIYLYKRHRKYMLLRDQVLPKNGPRN